MQLDTANQTTTLESPKARPTQDTAAIGWDGVSPADSVVNGFLTRMASLLALGGKDLPYKSVVWTWSTRKVP